MKKGISIVVAFVLVLFVALQFAGPAAAVKVVDKRTLYVTDTQDIDGHGKYTWTVYQYSKNNLWIHWQAYQKVGTKYKRVNHAWTQLKKINKKTLRIKETSIEGGWIYTYKKTKLTAARYYWRIYRPWQTHAWSGPGRVWA